jgi:phosphatidyl-myo-inositol dimannoside synthase
MLPTVGHSGGIEAYNLAVVEGLRELGCDVREMTFLGPSAPGRATLLHKMRFAASVLRSAWECRGEESLLIAAFQLHFLFLALLAKWLARQAAPTLKVFSYGAEIWGPNRLFLMALQRCRCEAVTISAFSAGALARFTTARVLRPGIRQSTYQALSKIVRAPREDSSPLRAISVFRLADDSKRADLLLEVVERLRLGGRDINLVLAGRGPAPEKLKDAVAARQPWAKLVESPEDSQLCSLYAESDLFVLATKLSSKRGRPGGEGFGIALVEAALAGLPVIPPASGGSEDAFVREVTGLCPKDESGESLEELLAWCHDHPSTLQLMGRNARAWAGTLFDPERYGAAVAAAMLDRFDEPRPSLIVEANRPLP